VPHAVSTSAKELLAGGGWTGGAVHAEWCRPAWGRAQLPAGAACVTRAERPLRSNSRARAGAAPPMAGWTPDDGAESLYRRTPFACSLGGLWVRGLVSSGRASSLRSRSAAVDGRRPASSPWRLLRAVFRACRSRVLVRRVITVCNGANWTAPTIPARATPAGVAPVPAASAPVAPVAPVARAVPPVLALPVELGARMDRESSRAPVAP
jgi:hypothetical protein